MRVWLAWLALPLLIALLGPASAEASTCQTWLTSETGARVRDGRGPTSAQRRALRAAGGAVIPLESAYYAAWFPKSWGTTNTKRVFVALHGTNGAPEAEWNDWKAQLSARGWGFLGLAWYDPAARTYDDDLTIYRRLSAALDQATTPCELAGASIYLLGFSRGSAMSFPVTYLDRQGRRLFKATVGNAGAWPPAGPLYPTMAALEARKDTSAFAGSRFWLYCGERDADHGRPMCDEMENARGFIKNHGAHVHTLYRDPAGRHDGLVHNPEAVRAMFAYLESL